MPLETRSDRSGVSKTAMNSLKDLDGDHNKNHKAAKEINGTKRSAENSPEGVPSNKRSVFGDITNACKVAIDGKQDTSRLTRSHSWKSLQQGAQKSPQKIRRSKRLCEQKENQRNCSESGTSGDSSSSSSSYYETTNESFSSSLELMHTANESLEKDNEVISHAEERDFFPSPPAGIHNYDKESALDPFSVPLYAQDIFQYFRRRETKFLPDKYMKRQSSISKGMRGILVDWMAEVQESFELNHETLYLGVKLVDLYLSRELIMKNVLQLLGSTALLVAAKFDERSPPLVDDFLYICDDAYNRKQLIQMEIKLLKTVDYDLGIPLSYSFLRRYARCSMQTMELLTLARYILELTLLEYEMVDVPDSLIAAASLSLALQMKKMDPWSPTLEYYSGYSLPELTDLIHRLNAMLVAAEHKNLNTIPNKYSHKVFFEVAKIPPLEVIST